MKSVMTGMSGGVDSSVAACILKEQGYTVLGCTLETTDNKDIKNAQTDASDVARTLGIEHFVLDLKDEFENTVIKYFTETYLNGKTPNPCVFCNKNLKFPSILHFAKEKGCDFIATGHYANVEESNGRFLLKKAKDITKDQTYMLYRLTQDILSKTLFPLGDMTKKEIREYAREKALPVAEKKDSQDICFVKDTDYCGFIAKRADLSTLSGNFTDISGNVIARHKGLAAYTIGQRKGLGIASDVENEPYYVVRKDINTKEVVLGREKDLYSKSVIIRDLNFIPFEKINGTLTLEAKLRYSQKASKCRVTQTDENECVLEFDEPQRAVTPGQSAVLYDDGYVVGGGIIQ